MILIEKKGAVGLLTLNRPQALNALSRALIEELAKAVDTLEADPAIKVLVLTGSEKAFAAGADIKEMAPKKFIDVYKEDLGGGAYDRVARCRKPVIAAVQGYALGGGCELAMMCDFIVASETARFGQPEITLGTVPGFGGTQRLTRLIGRARAMEMCLTGRQMEAQEALATGLVARVLPSAGFMAEVLKIAEKIASFSLPATMLMKEAVNRADETSLSEGLRFERRLFQASFDLADQKEGMAAFSEKRKPEFRDN